jgi:DNA-binding transcriptional LysR family regulator
MSNTPPDKLIPKTIVGRLDIVLLQSLIALSESTSLSKAARKLNIPQPTMSLQLKRLEERTGRNLFESGGRGKAVRLTQHGKQLVEYAKRIMSIHEETVFYLSSPDLTGEVSIGVPEWFAEFELIEVLSKYREAFPNVRVGLVVEPSDFLRAKIISGELDVCLSLTGDGLEPFGEPWTEPLHWVANHGLDCLKMEILPVALFYNAGFVRPNVVQHFSISNRLWREEYVSNSMVTVRSAVVAGLTVSVFAASSITSEMTIIDDVDGFAPLPPLKLVIYRSTLRVRTPEADALAEHLNKHISDKMQSYLPKSRIDSL